jgi:hypothetical protein
MNPLIRSLSVARFRSPTRRWFSLSSLLEGLAVSDPSSLKPYSQVLVLVVAFGIGYVLFAREVGGTGLEPVTSTMSTWHSGQLS